MDVTSQLGWVDPIQGFDQQDLGKLSSTRLEKKKFIRISPGRNLYLFIHNQFPPPPKKKRKVSGEDASFSRFK